MFFGQGVSECIGKFFRFSHTVIYILGVQYNKDFIVCQWVLKSRLVNNCMLTHIHHIIPKYLGGTDDPSNLVELTVEQHAEAHRLLYEQHGNWQDHLAWKALSGHLGKEEIIRIKQSMAKKGTKHSPESLAKLKESCAKRTDRQRLDGTLERANKKRSESHKGKKKSAEHIANWAAARKGHAVSDETREKIRRTLAETRAKKKALLEGLS